jgi:hypothetical protein
MGMNLKYYLTMKKYKYIGACVEGDDIEQVAAESIRVVTEMGKSLEDYRELCLLIAGKIKSQQQ